VIAFLLAKYLSLAVISCRALLLAALLGPISYGMLGTLVLVQQNLSYLALGARDGLTVKLAQAQNDRERVLLICSSTLFWAWCVSTLILIGSFVLVYAVGKGSLAWIWVGVVSYLSVINEILVNISRDKDKLLRVVATELTANSVPLLTALVFMHYINVIIVLMSIAAGLVLSIVIYGLDSRAFAWHFISRRITREVIVAGIQMAVMSFAGTSITTVFIFSANALKLGKTIGLLVFANSLCTIVLYGLNMMAWAATSRSMKSIHANASSDGARGARLRAIFRVGLIVCVSAMLALKVAFLFVLQAYAGSETFAVYMCLLQSYSLLLYREFNFLAVTQRSLWIAAGYGSVLLFTIGMVSLFPDVSILLLMQISLVLLGAISICCTYVCRRLGLRDGGGWPQYTFLCYPVLFGAAFAGLGVAGALVVTLAYGVLWLTVDGTTVRQLIARPAT
jgi:hypothetical protein